MITEYYTEKDIIKELDNVCFKFKLMLSGWFGDMLLKLFKRNKNGGKYNQVLHINKQKYIIIVTWGNRAHKTEDFAYNIFTHYESKNGKMTIHFDDEGNDIIITSPHYRKREKERSNLNIAFKDEIKKIKYVRNNKEYELLVNNDDIIISRRSKENPKLVYYITLLSRDMCNNKNYTNLISSIENNLNDFIDAYDWK